MSLISDVLGARRRQSGGQGVPLSLAFTADDVAWLMRSSYNYTPSHYAPEIALGLPAVMAVVNVLSNQLAAAPLHVYEPFEGGRRRVSSALANRLSLEWRVGETSFDARKRLMTIVLTQGVGYVWVERNERGGPIGLHVLSKRMIEEHVVDGTTIYKPCAEVYGLLPDQMGIESVIRIKFMTDDEGCRYLNPLQRCWQAIRAGLAAQGISATYFENGMQPQVLFTSPIEDEDNAQALRNTLNNILNKMRKKGDSNILLPAGVDAKTISTDPRHAQLLELRRFAVQEVCRLYQVSPGIVQELSQGKYDNVEQGNLFFSQHALVPWAVQLEQEFRRVLWPAPSSRFAKLEMTGLLRGDYRTRTDGYSRSVQSGFMTPNEIRELEDLPGLPGGDELYMQKQMVPIGREDEEEPVAEEVAIEDEDEDDVDDVDEQDGDDDTESVEEESENIENQVRNRLVSHRFGNQVFHVVVEKGPARLNGGGPAKESAMKAACRVEYDRAGRPVVCDDNLIGTGGMSREQWQDIVDRLDERRRRAREGRIRHLGFSELSRQSMMRHRECESLAIVVRDDSEPEPADREESDEAKEDRADEETTGGVDIAGYGLRWEETTTLWEGGGDYPTYTESFTKGAFDGRMGDVRLLRNHGDLALARTSQGTMTTKEDKDGLAFTASLSMDDPAARGLATKLERGDVDKMSVGFSMRQGKSTFTIDDESNVVHEEILRVGELFEISAVNWPAYDSSEVSLKGRNEAPADRGTRTKHEEPEQRSADPDPAPEKDEWEDDFAQSLRQAEADLASFGLA